MPTDLEQTLDNLHVSGADAFRDRFGAEAYNQLKSDAGKDWSVTVATDASAVRIEPFLDDDAAVQLDKCQSIADVRAALASEAARISTAYAELAARLRAQ